MFRESIIAAKNLLLGGNLETFGFLPTPVKAVGYVNECRFLARMLRPNGDLPQRNVWEVLNATSDIPVILHPIATRDWFTQVASLQADLIALCMLCAATKPRKIFEIGTLHGSGTLQMALNAPQANVFTLDLADSPHLKTTEVDRRIAAEGKKRMLIFEGLPEASRIRPLYGDSATFDFSPFANSIDLFFIDGAHSYEYVKNDTMQAMKCTRKGGIIAWHDYGRCGVNGVTQWLNEFRSQGHDVWRVPGGSLAFLVNH